MNSKLQNKIFPILFCVCVFFAAFAKADVVDEYVRAEMAEQHVPGAAIAVVKKR